VVFLLQLTILYIKAQFLPHHHHQPLTHKLLILQLNVALIPTLPFQLFLLIQLSPLQLLVPLPL
jgi:hypothetical protein